MSCTNVTITVTWTAPGAGEVHNMTIGYREQGSGLPYTIIPATSLGGVPGSQDIIVPCANCNGVVYEGYIEDDCGSPQIPWTAIAFPEGSDCQEYEWCCTLTSVGAIDPGDISNAGTEYTPGDMVLFIGGNPSVPAAGNVFTVDAVGGITAINLVTPGSLYESIPVIQVVRSVAPTPGAIDAVINANLEDCVPIDYEYCHFADPPIVGQVTLEFGHCYKECTTPDRYAAKVQTIEDAGRIEEFTHELTGIDCDCDDNCKQIEIVNNSGADIDFYYQTCDSGGGVEPGTSYFDTLADGGTWVSGTCIMCDTVRIVGGILPPDVTVTCTVCV